MREILFRAKAINRDDGVEHRTNYKNGDWVYGLISQPYNDMFPTLPMEMRNTNGVVGIEVDYKTLGQYTGLTCRGEKIFEGDILEVGEGENAQRVWVFFEDGQFVVSHFALKLLRDRTLNSKIIGNIHDNPELLEKDNA